MCNRTSGHLRGTQHDEGYAAASEVLLITHVFVSCKQHVETGPLRFGQQDAVGYSIFTSGVYRATTPDVAFPQEKPHFAELDCAE
jgi:hypothetical protein